MDAGPCYSAQNTDARAARAATTALRCLPRRDGISPRAIASCRLYRHSRRKKCLRPGAHRGAVLPVGAAAMPMPSPASLLCTRQYLLVCANRCHDIYQSAIMRLLTRHVFRHEAEIVDSELLTSRQYHCGGHNGPPLRLFSIRAIYCAPLPTTRSLKRRWPSGSVMLSGNEAALARHSCR